MGNSQKNAQLDCLSDTPKTLENTQIDRLTILSFRDAQNTRKHNEHTVQLPATWVGPYISGAQTYKKKTQDTQVCCPQTGWCQVFLVPRNQKTHWIQTVLLSANCVVSDTPAAQTPENTLKTHWIHTVLLSANWVVSDTSGAQTLENTLNSDSSAVRKLGGARYF